MLHLKPIFVLDIIIFIIVYSNTISHFLLCLHGFLFVGFFRYVAPTGYRSYSAESTESLNMRLNRSCMKHMSVSVRTGGVKTNCSGRHSRHSRAPRPCRHGRRPQYESRHCSGPVLTLRTTQQTVRSCKSSYTVYNKGKTRKNNRRTANWFRT